MKKKIMMIVFALSLGLLLTGCNNEIKVMKCTRAADLVDYKLNFTYKVTYQSNEVKKVESIETIETVNQELLGAWRDNIENIYKPYEDIEYYDYSIEINDNVLTSKVTIDYEHVSTDKLIEIDSANNQLIKDGKVSIDDVKAIYEQTGATCEG